VQNQAGRRVRNKGPQKVEHLTGNGVISIWRRVYWSRSEGSDRRLDGWLGILQSNVSVVGRELCCRVATAGQVSFDKASGNLERIGGIRIGREWLREIVEAEGKAVIAAREAGTVRPDWQAKDCVVDEHGKSRVMAGSDGVMVPLITEAEKSKRLENLSKKRQGKKAKSKRRARRERGSEQSYGEFKIADFYDESRQRQYAFATSGDHNAMGRMMRKEAAKLRLSEADEKIAVSDGAKWIRKQFDIRLPMLDAVILDFFHFAEHVAQASRTCFGEGTQEATGWTHDVLEAARTQGPAEVLVKIQQALKGLRSPAKRAAMQSLQQYISTRCDMLDYPSYRAKGWDIGSGVTESFCKTLTARLKGSGMRWNRSNAEAMMALAALDQSNLSQSYWEHQRMAAA
jgi:hypothetical protein